MENNHQLYMKKDLQPAGNKYSSSLWDSLQAKRSIPLFENESTSSPFISLNNTQNSYPDEKKVDDTEELDIQKRLQQMQKEEQQLREFLNMKERIKIMQDRVDVLKEESNSNKLRKQLKVDKLLNTISKEKISKPDSKLKFKNTKQELTSSSNISKNSQVS